MLLLDSHKEWRNTNSFEEEAYEISNIPLDLNVELPLTLQKMFGFQCHEMDLHLTEVNGGFSVVEWKSLLWEENLFFHFDASQ